jgi:hypothetical protein
MVASFTTLFVCLRLYTIQGEYQKKSFSLFWGLTINFYVFGITALASLG